MTNVSAIRINEVESNPAGKDSGNEWVELYSEEEIDLSAYKLMNNDGDEINLEASFSGYYIYTFISQWLDNNDEKVFLYENDELIDQSKILDDNKNDDGAWSYCGGWEFIKSTKGEENVCAGDVSEDAGTEDISQQQDQQQQTQQNQTTDADEDDTGETQTTTNDEAAPITMSTIKLNPKDIKSESDNEDLTQSQYAIYGFVLFCILLVVLFISKKLKEKHQLDKNEFSRPRDQEHSGGNDI